MNLNSNNKRTLLYGAVTRAHARTHMHAYTTEYAPHRRNANGQNATHSHFVLFPIISFL